MTKSKKVNIGIFASGSGTNAENIIKHFQNHKTIGISYIFCNNPEAYVIERAKKMNIPVFIFDKKDFMIRDVVLDKLSNSKIDFIVLAGFLWLVPSKIINAYQNRIINIHPALLPKYGGKGMYGQYVHQAVFMAAEKETGITIHWVDEKYDEGAIIYQKTVSINVQDNPETIALKVHKLEHEVYPKIIEQSILKNII